MIDCRISDTAGVGIRLDLYCQRNRIIGNVIEYTGWTGILLAGYGPGTKDVNHHNVVENNYLHHIGLLYRTAIGIHLFQCGERKSMQHAPGERQNMEWAKGFEFKHTRNNLIERNEIFNVSERLSEANGTYVAGVGPGNVLRENFIHSTHVLNSQFAALRCDDHTWHTTYARNVVWNVGCQRRLRQST